MNSDPWATSSSVILRIDICFLLHYSTPGPLLLPYSTSIPGSLTPTLLHIDPWVLSSYLTPHRSQSPFLLPYSTSIPGSITPTLPHIDPWVPYSYLTPHRSLGPLLLPHSSTFIMTVYCFLFYYVHAMWFGRLLTLGELTQLEVATGGNVRMLDIIILNISDQYV